MKTEVLKIALCGEVDHGKSTLLGRLLWETGSLPPEKRFELKRVSGQLGKDIEPAFLVDQFREEREEERTIDTTQVFFKTRKRRYCLIDTPGHVEFIKNMMTGACQAEAGLLLIDASGGVRKQTKRHVHLLRMFGIRDVIVAVNKMDLIGFDKKKFDEIKAEVLDFFKQCGLKASAVIPVSAKKGDNIVRRSPSLAWHKGPTLVAALDALSFAGIRRGRSLRLPIQDVYRDGSETIYVGRVESGRVKVKQKVVLFPSGRQTQVLAIKVFGPRKISASTGENVGLVLKDAFCAKRGEVVCAQGVQAAARPFCFSSFQGSVFWLSQRPLKVQQSFTLRCATQEASGIVEKIKGRMDSATLEVMESDPRAIERNELGRVVFNVKPSLVLERFDQIAPLGRFVIEEAGKISGFGVFLK